MLRNILKKFLFLIVSLLLAGCASQKSITQLAASPSQPVTVEKEATPVKETGGALEQTTVSKTEPVPEKVSVTLNVQFDTGRANINPKYHADIKRIADFMSKYPAATAVIEGHTDNVGKEAVNVKLSWRRASNIKLYLTEKFGIERSRIRVIGYDYQKPIAGNGTEQGRQANRRGGTHMEINPSRNSLYSFFEDSDLLRGGFSVVNQETIDAKIKSFQEKQGVASYLSKIVEGPTLELYLMWGGVFSHCALRIETNPNSFYQLELQTLPDLKKAGLKDFQEIGAAINLLGVTKDQFDIVEFTDKNERGKLDHAEPHDATMPICIDKKAARQTTKWYKDCLRRYARSYNPENAQKAGKPAKAFEYDPIIHNCCNFAEEALQACGLAHCFDLGKSTGLNRKAGPLEE